MNPPPARSAARLPAVLLVLLPAFSAGCVPTIEFDVPISDEAVIESGTVLEQLLSGFGFEDLVSMDLSQTNAFENNDVRKAQVEEARLTQLTLTTTAPDGATFDFLDSIAFSVAAPELPDELVASKTVGDVASFDCDLEDVDLAPYVRAESFSLTTDVDGRRPDEDTTVQAQLVFHIVARPL